MLDCASQRSKHRNLCGVPTREDTDPIVRDLITRVEDLEQKIKLLLESRDAERESVNALQNRYEQRFEDVQAALTKSQKDRALVDAAVSELENSSREMKAKLEQKTGSTMVEMVREHIKIVPQQQDGALELGRVNAKQTAELAPANSQSALPPVPAGETPIQQTNQQSVEQHTEPDQRSVVQPDPRQTERLDALEDFSRRIMDQLEKKPSGKTIEDVQRELDQQLESGLASVSAALRDTINSELNQSLADKELADKEIAKPSLAESLHPDEAVLVTWEESVWDISFLIFMPCFSVADSIVSVILITVNVAMQLTICGIVQDLFTEVPFSLNSATLFRQNIGHASDYSRGDESLVKKICREDADLVVAGVQSGAHDDIKEYLGPFNGIASMKVGQVLCIQCLTVWFFVVYAEWAASLNQLSGIFGLKSFMGRSTLEVLDDSPDVITVTSMSLGRKALCALLGITRLFIGLLLSYSGAVWLIHTTNVRDLLLNASALAFVLDIDSLLFAVFVPLKLQVAMQKLTPLTPLHAQGNIGAMIDRLRKVIPVKSLLGLVALMIYGAVCLPLLSPTVEDIVKTLDAFCGGDQNFILSLHAPTGIVFRLNGAAGESKGSGPIPKMTPQLIHGTSEEQYVWEAVPKRNEVMGYDMDNFAAIYADCKDSLAHHKYLLPPVRAILARPNITCESLTLLECDLADTVRMACPRKCGCPVGVFGLFNVKGCTKCTKFAQKQHIHRRNDIDWITLLKMPEWKEYWTSYVRLMETSPELDTYVDKAGNASTVAKGFMTKGCHGLYEPGKRGAKGATFSRRKFFCAEKNDLRYRSLGAFCPAACRCWPNTFHALTGAAFPPSKYCAKQYPTIGRKSVLHQRVYIDASAVGGGTGCAIVPPKGWFQPVVIGLGADMVYDSRGHHVFYRYGEWELSYEKAKDYDYLPYVLGLKEAWTLRRKEDVGGAYNIPPKIEYVAYAKVSKHTKYTDEYSEYLRHSHEPPNTGWTPYEGDGCAAEIKDYATEYYLTKKGKFLCDSGVKIATESDCATAAAAYSGVQYALPADDVQFPPGCYLLNDDKYLFAQFNYADPAKIDEKSPGYVACQAICKITASR